MDMSFSAAEESALRGLVGGSDGEIILRLDRDGLIAAASPNIRALGLDPCEMLIKPHVADLAERDHREAVNHYVSRTLSGIEPNDQIEFPLALASSAENAQSMPNDSRHWHALRIHPIAGPDSQSIVGGMGLLRSIERLRSLESELNLSSTTDPLTGLDNQQSFLARLERVVACESQSVVMLFEIDSFRALQLQYGRSAADEVLWAFARFLQTMTPEERCLARLQGERFGAVLADCSIEQARIWGEEVRSIFAGLTATQTARKPQVSINIGLAHCGGSADQSLQHAELALLLARAKGRSGGCVADHNAFSVAPELGVMTSSR